MLFNMVSLCNHYLSRYSWLIVLSIIHKVSIPYSIISTFKYKNFNYLNKYVIKYKFLVFCLNCSNITVQIASINLLLNINWVGCEVSNFSNRLSN